MVVVAKGYRVVPQSLEGGTGFRHVHLKEHRGVFKATRSSDGDGSGELVVAKGRTLFVGNVDDQGAPPCVAYSVSGFPNSFAGVPVTQDAQLPLAGARVFSYEYM